MRPKKHATTREGDLFRARLDQIINMKHELVVSGGYDRTSRLFPWGSASAVLACPGGRELCGAL